MGHTTPICAHSEFCTRPMCAKAIQSAPAPYILEYPFVRDKCIEDGASSAVFLDSLHLWAIYIATGMQELHNSGTNSTPFNNFRLKFYYKRCSSSWKLFLGSILLVRCTHKLQHDRMQLRELHKFKRGFLPSRIRRKL